MGDMPGEAEMGTLRSSNRMSKEAKSKSPKVIVGEPCYSNLAVKIYENICLQSNVMNMPHQD